MRKTFFADGKRKEDLVFWLFDRKLGSYQNGNIDCKENSVVLRSLERINLDCFVYW